MGTTVKILRYLIITVVVALLGGAAGWFFFVRSHQGSLATQSEAGKSNEEAPFTEAISPALDAATNVLPGGATPGIPSGTKAITQLWRVSQGPVAGFSFIAQKALATSSVHLYFAERANGNVFDADAITQTVIRLTNTLIPKTYEAIFSPKGGAVLMRSLDGESITTLLASFATSASTTTFPQALGGPTLAANIRAIAADPDPKSGAIFYLVPVAGGGTLGMLSSFAGGKPQQVFSSPIASWRAQYAASKVVLLLAPSEGAPGYAYTLGTSGALSLYAGPLSGLMILPHPTEDALVYSGSSGGRLSLFARKSKEAPTELSVQTIAEKCVWSPDKSLTLYCAVPKAVPQSGFIDAWYQGALHTNDTWWQIDVGSGTAGELFTPNSPIDVHDLRIDPSGNYIAFTNGVDMSLWVLAIVQ